jgi:hypothetical protein
MTLIVAFAYVSVNGVHVTLKHITSTQDGVSPRQLETLAPKKKMGALERKNLPPEGKFFCQKASAFPRKDFSFYGNDACWTGKGFSLMVKDFPFRRRQPPFSRWLGAFPRKGVAFLGCQNCLFGRSRR